MKFSPPFLRFATLPAASLLFIMAFAALSPVRATGYSEAEAYVLKQVLKGDKADLTIFPEGRRKVRAGFIFVLFTSDDLLNYSQRGLSAREDPFNARQRAVWIKGAVVSGWLVSKGQEILSDIHMDGCTFEDDINFSDSHFAKGLALTNSNFKGVDFSDVTIDLDFDAKGSSFEKSVDAKFEGLRVGGGLRIDHSTFDGVVTSFEWAQVAGPFIADDSTFASGSVSFMGMRANGGFSAQRCAFNCIWLNFSGAHFTDFSLQDSGFDWVRTIDFTNTEADLISFEGVTFHTSDVRLQRLTFKFIKPFDAERLSFLLRRYDPEFYTNLESSFRTHGYSDEADKIFIAKRRAERRENCKSFLHECDRGAWAWSMFQDALAGYGRHLENLLYWSLGFLIVGMLVFRSEKGMRLKDEKDAAHKAGRYNAFWYSLDLFLPIIKLGEADVWTPKDNRRWANLYRKVHIIIGSLFVPIGLAAWTGIIK